MTTSTHAHDALTADLTVNEIVARFPETVAVFNQYGVDTCCGGGVPLRLAAERDGLDPDVLLAAVKAASDPG
jgi:regulator of cell morphogenesis and NO signaling